MNDEIEGFVLVIGAIWIFSPLVAIGVMLNEIRKELVKMNKFWDRGNEDDNQNLVKEVNEILDDEDK